MIIKKSISLGLPLALLAVLLPMTAWGQIQPDNDVFYWVRFVGTSASDTLRDIVTVRGGALIVAERYGSNSVTRDVWLAKIDEEGDLVWSRILDGVVSGETRDDHPDQLVPTADGAFLVGWSSRIRGGGLVGWLINLDDVGRVRWVRTLPDELEVTDLSVVALPDGGAIASGRAANPTTRRRDTAYIARFSSEGAVRWQRIWNVGGRPFNSSVVTTTDGMVVAAFGVAWPIDYRGVGPPPGAIIKLDLDGSTIWTRGLRGTNGQATQPTALLAQPGGGAQVLFENYSGIVELAADGSFLWSRFLSGWPRFPTHWPSDLTWMEPGASLAVLSSGDLNTGPISLVLSKLDDDGLTPWTRQVTLEGFELWRPRATPLAVGFFEGWYHYVAAHAVPTHGGPADILVARVDPDVHVPGCDIIEDSPFVSQTMRVDVLNYPYPAPEEFTDDETTDISFNSVSILATAGCPLCTFSEVVTGTSSIPGPSLEFERIPDLCFELPNPRPEPDPPVDWRPYESLCNDDPGCTRCVQMFGTGRPIQNPGWRANLYEALGALKAAEAADENVAGYLESLRARVRKVPSGRFATRARRNELTKALSSPTSDHQRTGALLWAFINRAELDLVTPPIRGETLEPGESAWLGDVVQVKPARLLRATRFGLEIRAGLPARSASYRPGRPAATFVLDSEFQGDVEVAVRLAGMRFDDRTLVRMLTFNGTDYEDVTKEVDLDRGIVRGLVSPGTIFTLAESIPHIREQYSIRHQEAPSP